ncbi:MAG TPA: universal stress protein [Vicinamibacterales bacterium]|nr:universal stress protein [Vicinamibacterales bacterium]
MKQFSRILIDLDASAKPHPALDAAFDVARRCHAAVKIVDVLGEVPFATRHYLTPQLEADLVAHRLERLRTVAARFTDVAVTTDVLRGRPATALIREVVSARHDLLVRTHGRDLAEGGKLFGPIDLELLRLCPCPVWLAGAKKPRGAMSQLLAAIHANPADPAEQQLNESILDLALMMKGLMGGRLHIVQAWIPFGETLLASHMPAHELTQYLEATRVSEQQALTDVTRPFTDRLGNAAVELLKGEPEDVIQRYVDEHSIDLVVMGTVARTGLAGALIGNTAERVLQRLRVSVLATKPAGFTSPVLP